MIEIIFIMCDEAREKKPLSVNLGLASDSHYGEPSKLFEHVCNP